MRRLIVLVAIALGFTAAAFVGLSMSGPQSASAGGVDGLKCYRVKVLQSASSINRTIYIQDQFEAKNIIVKKPTEYCSLASKGFGGGDSAGAFLGEHPLTCYAIKDAPRQAKFQRVELLAADQFTESHLQVTKPYSLCEESIKGKGTGVSAGFGGEPFDDFSFKCYKVRSLESGSRFEKRTVDVRDQFTMQDGKQTRVLRPALFCSQVEEKKRKAKNDDIDNAPSINYLDEVHVSTISTDAFDPSDPPMNCNDEVASYGHSVWYSFYPTDDVYVHLDTIGSTFDTVLGIFSGSPGNLTQIDCNDDGGPDFSSVINTKVPADQKYWIVAGSYGGTGGGKLKLFMALDEFDCIITCGSGTTSATQVIDQDEGSSAGDYPQDLMCYAISQRAPDAEEVFVSNQLNEHVLEIGRGTMYCAEADKCVLLPRPSGAPEAAGPPQKCAF